MGWPPRDPGTVGGVVGEAERAERLRMLVTRTCVVVLALVAVVRLVPTTADLVQDATATSPPVEGRVNTTFVDWVRAHTREGDAYWLATKTAWHDPAASQWLTFRLLPRRPA